MSREAIALAMTGASGAVYGLRLLECLLQAQQTVYLMLSPAAQIVLAQETDLKVPGAPAEQEKFFGARYCAREGQQKAVGPDGWFSPPARGCNEPSAGRQMGLPAPPGRIAASAPLVHGQPPTPRGTFEPLAGGENQAFGPNAFSCPSRAP